MRGLEGFTDADATRAIVRAMRLVGILTVIAAPIVGWKMGWPSAGLLVVGAAISAAGLWKWLNLMTVVMAKMDAEPDAEPDADGERVARPMGRVLLGFFLTLGLMVGVLYGSLKILDGSVFALAAGLAMGIFALGFEGLRLAKAWTV